VAMVAIMALGPYQIEFVCSAEYQPVVRRGCVSGKHFLKIYFENVLTYIFDEKKRFKTFPHSINRTFVWLTDMTAIQSFSPP
jgi:hypothetical protein